MLFPDSFFEDEVRDGFYVPALMKRSWAAQIEVLEEVARICKKHHIRWFADRGTLLGAVRHKGFIPWDDDLDICMLRDDYIRFNAVIRRELPKGFYIPESTVMGYRLLTRVCNGKSICIKKDFLEKYHGFPFVAGIDIFALDYVSCDPEAENLRKKLAVIVYKAVTLVNDENQNTHETEELVSQVEKLLHIRLNRSISLNTQLFTLLEDLFGKFPASQAKEVAYMPNWIFDNVWKFPLDCYRSSVLLPFEYGEIAVPVLYQETLKLQFGEHYMTPYRSGGGHDYPCHQPQMEQMAEALEGGHLPFEYRFSPEDLVRPHSRNEQDTRLPQSQGQQSSQVEPPQEASGNVRLQQETSRFLHLTADAHKDILKAIQASELATARTLLQICQENAIYIGTALEQACGEGISAVKLLEEYCDVTYQIHEKLEDASDGGKDVELLDSLLEKIEFSFGFCYNK